MSKVSKLPVTGSVPTLDQRMLRNMDGFINAMTGAGTAKDKSFHTQFQTKMLDERLLLDLYTDHDLAATIVERITKDALRSGYELNWKGATDAQRRDVVDWAENRYHVTEEVKQGRVWGRLFGGAGVFMGIEGNIEAPAMMGQEVGFLRAVDGTDMWGDKWYSDPSLQSFASVGMYRMRIMQFGAQSMGTVVEPLADIHESRVVPFYGIKTTDRQMRHDRGWGKSVLQRVYEVLMKFDSGFDSVLNTLLEMSVPVYKVKALLDLLASENGELLAKRFELINTAKGAYNAVILDMEESLERVEANIAQASPIIDMAMVRVAAAAGMPVTILFGRAPAGQNATGQSDLENWNQQVASEQRLELGPAIARIYRWLLASPESPVKNVDELQVTWPAVETPSLQDQVNLYAQRAGADKVYFDIGAATGPEIALKRAQEPGGQFPTVDMAHLRELDELQKERLLDPPDPMAMMAEGGDDEPEEDDDDPATD